MDTGKIDQKLPELERIINEMLNENNRINDYVRDVTGGINKLSGTLPDAPIGTIDQAVPATMIERMEMQLSMMRSSSDALFRVRDELCLLVGGPR